MQLTGLTNTYTQGSYYGAAVNMQYNYTAGQNNGRVAQTVDGVLGETVNYSYDMWNRLTHAAATNGAWGEQYTFDYFGNLTNKTPTAGSAPEMSVPYNPATNQPTTMGTYDANGNPPGVAVGSGGPAYSWNVENRLASSSAITGVDSPTSYIYDPWGRRIWMQVPTTTGSTGEVYFYGATGQKLETYSFTWNSTFGAGLEGINIYFGGKLLQSKGVWVATDRQGSVRANSNLESMSYFPYGEERTSTANSREKFATYTRDAPGQDYAMARYFNGSIGAFWSPDPGGVLIANSSDPTTWNRYMYAGGDPANHSDRRGMEVGDTCGTDWMTNAAEDGPCCDPSEEGFLGAPADPGCCEGGGSGGATSSSSDDEEDPAQCPLEAPTGDFTVAPGVVARFAPDMVALIDKAFATLNQEGITPTITSGFRTAAGQAAQQGSPYGAAQVSWHQVGEAIDINSHVPAATERAIVAAMTGAGLVWGGRFTHPDPVHFQDAPAGTSPTSAQVAACASEHP